MTYVSELRERWMKNPGFRAEYEAVKPTFELMMTLAEVRSSAGLTQQELAERMGTTQSAIARLEGWSSNPSTSTLRRFAEATGTRLKISFEPIGDAGPIDNGDKTAESSGDLVDAELAATRSVEPAIVSA